MKEITLWKTVPTNVYKVIYRFIDVFSRTLIFVFSRVFLHFKVNYSEKLPKSPKIFVLNHPTTVDPFLSLLISPEKCFILVWEVLFKIPVLGWFIRNLGHIPVNHNKGYLAYNQALSYLKQGKNVVIFPEGSVSESPLIYKTVKSGAVRLAIETGATIVPVGIGIHPNYQKRYFAKMDKNEINTVFYSGPYVVTVGKTMKFKISNLGKKVIRERCDLLTQNINALMEISRNTVEGMLERINIRNGINRAFSFALYQIIFLIQFIR